jgi:hypothetical protein
MLHAAATRVFQKETNGVLVSNVTRQLFDLLGYACSGQGFAASVLLSMDSVPRLPISILPISSWMPSVLPILPIPWKPMSVIIKMIVFVAMIAKGIGNPGILSLIKQRCEFTKEVN